MRKFGYLTWLLFWTCLANAQWVQTNGPGGGGINCFAEKGTYVFAGTPTGIYRSTDQGASWTVSNNGLGGSTNVHVITVVGNEVFAGLSSGGAGGGVYVSSDDGLRWTAAMNGIGNGSVQDFVFDGTSLFAGTPAGVFRYDAIGKTWTAFSSGLGSNPNITSLTVTHSGSGSTTLFAAVYGIGIYRSTDGSSWSMCSNVVDGGGTMYVWVDELAVGPNATGGTNLYVGTRMGVYRSADNGNSWKLSMLAGTQIYDFAVSGTTIFAGTWYNGVFRSTDFGASWNPSNNGFTNKNILALMAGESVLFAGTNGAGVFTSGNNGASWSLSSDGIVNTDVRAVVSSGDNIFAGTYYGGAFFSPDYGTTWSAINNGLTNMIVQAMAVKGTTIFAGTNAISSSAGVFRSTNNGATWTAANNGLTDYNITCFAVSGDKIFAGTYTSGVFRSTDDGLSWEQVNSRLTYMTSLVTNADYLFAATVNKGVFRSSDDGASWDSVTTGLWNLGPNALAASGANILAGTGSGLFLSSNNGTTWSWLNVLTGNNTVKAFTVIGANVFAATSGGGVFRSTNNGLTWSEINTGLSLPNFASQTISANSTHLFLGTTPRGVWKRPLSDFQLQQTYEITVIQTPNGTITPGTTSVDHGNNQSFTFTPSTGYYVDDVLADGSSVDSVTSYTFANVTAAHTISARFVKKRYSLSVTTINGSILKAPDQATYDSLATVQLTAVPATGYHFLSWSGSVNSTANPLTITMDGNKAITANFAINTYSLNTTAVNGSVAKDPDRATYDSLTSVQLTGVPATGYHFVSWSGSINSTANPLMIVMDGNKAITANFAINTYSLNTTAVNGSVVKDPDRATYDSLTSIQLTAMPATGYHFVNWSGSASGTTNPLAITMDGNKAITANFAINTYSLNTTAINGSVVKDPDRATYDSLTTVQLTATPATGYHFVSWSGSVNSTTNPMMITMDGNKAITAHFAINTYSLSITAVNGSVAKNPDQATYDSLTSVQLTAFPEKGYHFVNWSGSASGTTNPLTIAMDGNKAITAHFAINTYMLTVNATNGNVIKNPDRATYDYRTPVQLTARPATGYHFVYWSGSASGTTNPLTIMMDGDKAIRANFEINTYSLNITAVNGSVAKAPDRATYDSLTSVQLTATPATGYHFVSWSVSVNSTTNPLTITMDGNKAITANFAVTTFTISGYVRLFGGEPIGGVQIYGPPENPMTDGNGYYTATVNFGWSGTATPTKPGYLFAPGSIPYISVATVQSNQDYTGTKTMHYTNAPFQGGSGDGYASMTSTHILLSGEDFEKRYKGGIGDGYVSVGSPHVLLNGMNFDVKYRGGFGDGYATVASLLVLLNGAWFDVKYHGGSGDGYSSSFSPHVLLDGANFDVKFSGGIGDGYISNSSPHILLNGMNFDVKYRGGKGDGYSSVASLHLLLNGAWFDARYHGSFADGYAMNSSSLRLLDGLDFLSRYRGGSGDGYAMSEFLQLSSQLQLAWNPVTPANENHIFRGVGVDQKNNLLYISDSQTDAVYIFENDSTGIPVGSIKDASWKTESYGPYGVDVAEDGQVFVALMTFEDRNGDGLADHSLWKCSPDGSVISRVCMLPSAPRGIKVFGAGMKAVVFVAGNLGEVIRCTPKTENEFKAEVLFNTGIKENQQSILPNEAQTVFYASSWTPTSGETPYNTAVTKWSPDGKRDPDFSVPYLPEGNVAGMCFDRDEAALYIFHVGVQGSDSHIYKVNPLTGEEISSVVVSRGGMYGAGGMSLSSSGDLYFARTYDGPSGSQSSTANYTSSWGKVLDLSASLGRKPVVVAAAGIVENKTSQTYSLAQNYPNPFNPATNFEFVIPHPGLVSLKVFDALGREVATLVHEVKTPGTYKLRWDAGSLPSGVYFSRLSAGAFSESKKLVLIR